MTGRNSGQTPQLPCPEDGITRCVLLGYSQNLPWDSASVRPGGNWPDSILSIAVLPSLPHAPSRPEQGFLGSPPPEVTSPLKSLSEEGGWQVSFQ